MRLPENRRILRLPRRVMQSIYFHDTLVDHVLQRTAYTIKGRSNRLHISHYNAWTEALMTVKVHYDVAKGTQVYSGLIIEFGSGMTWPCSNTRISNVHILQGGQFLQIWSRVQSNRSFVKMAQRTWCAHISQHPTRKNMRSQMTQQMPHQSRIILAERGHHQLNEHDIVGSLAMQGTQRTRIITINRLTQAHGDIKHQRECQKAFLS